ncbi:MAG TPA: hypothetical protein VLC10_03925 [Patescibacteria group bacterium]|nr:hypothetical protein [Patescibacteria group bacterium]
MAIVVGTHGPKLELLRAQQRVTLAKLQIKYQHDADVQRLLQLDDWSKTLNTALTANNDVTFDAVFTATGIS